MFLANNLRRYNTQDGNNHVLNGILFEIYFNSHGEFRGGDLKRHFFEEVIALKRYPAFAQSFSFIRTVLNPYRESLIYFIPEDDAKIDVDISLTEENVKNALHDLTYSVISLITVNGKDITELVKKNYLYRGISIQEAIAIATNAPIDAVTLHPNIPLLKNITFVKGDEDDAFYL